MLGCMDHKWIAELTDVSQVDLQDGMVLGAGKETDDSTMKS